MNICNNIGRDLPAEWVQELRMTINASYGVLEHLEKSGHPYKRVSRVILEYTTDPFWVGESETVGCVHINPFKHDARAFAHEIGHGFEERWRKGTSEVMGQSMAEAIRFFVEEKMGHLKWTPHSNWRVVIEMCSGDIEMFKKLLDGEELHQKYS